MDEPWMSYGRAMGELWIPYWDALLIGVLGRFEAKLSACVLPLSAYALTIAFMTWKVGFIRRAGDCFFK